MKILIVEDDNGKASVLRGVVQSAGVEEENVITVPDRQTAIFHLKTLEYSVLLLDLQIPNRYGDKPNVNGGAELIHQFLRRDTERLPACILAITSFDIDHDAYKILSNGGVSVIKYEASQDHWKNHIKGLIKRSLRSLNHSVSPIQKDPISSVILTAVDVEFEQARRVFNVSGGGEVIVGVSWHRGELKTRNVTRRFVLAQTSQMGMPAASVLATKALRLWEPEFVIMCGICAGVRGEVEIGDLVIPDPSWDYGSGKLVGDGVLRPDPRPLQLTESSRLAVMKARQMAPIEKWQKAWPAQKPANVPKVRVGPSASGASVLADSNTIEHIKLQSRKLIGVDMENYGVYFACANSGQEKQPMFCSVKAVVDFADSQKSDGVHEYASHLSAKFAQWMIENY